MNFVDGVVGEDGAGGDTLDAGALLSCGWPRRLKKLFVPGPRPSPSACGPSTLSWDHPMPNGAIRTRIGAVEPTGSTTYLFTDGAPELLVTTEGTARHRSGDAIGLTIAPQRVHLFDPQSGSALAP